jgi:hypothetical protein
MAGVMTKENWKYSGRPGRQAMVATDPNFQKWVTDLGRQAMPKTMRVLERAGRELKDNVQANWPVARPDLGHPGRQSKGSRQGWYWKVEITKEGPRLIVGNTTLGDLGVPYTLFVTYPEYEGKEHPRHKGRNFYEGAYKGGKPTTGWPIRDHLFAPMMRMRDRIASEIMEEVTR